MHLAITKIKMIQIKTLKDQSRKIFTETEHDVSEGDDLNDHPQMYQNLER